MLESDFWNLVVKYISLKNLSKLQIIKNPETVAIHYIYSIDKKLLNITYLLNFQLPNVTYLDLSCLNLKNIPCLPSGLKYLYCYNNQLQTFPTLPGGLEYLYCSSNQLQTLPNLPGGLKILWCYNNQLQSLPNLPNTLVQLRVRRNMADFRKLIEIPEECLVEYI